MYKTIKVELSYGCNLRCPFCGIQSMPKGDDWSRLMSEETIDQIAHRIAEDPKKLTVSFSLRGEPTLNPLYMYAIARLSTVAHKIFLVTNGTTLKSQDDINTMFIAGLDGLHIDVYSQKVADFVAKLESNWLYEVAPYGAKKVWTTKRLVSICDERETRQKNTRALHNWAGANDRFQEPYEPIPRMSPCAEPLKMITIRHDGTYALCCHTWNDKTEFGSVYGKSLREHYDCDSYKRIARAVMVEGGRTARNECRLCNVKSPFAHMFKRAVGV